MEGDGGNGRGVCLICRSSEDLEKLSPTSAAFYVKSSTSSLSSPPLLLKHLSTYFLIRHVLELPSEQLVKYLRGCPNPENWIKICSNCDKNYVEKCSRIFGELLEVKRRFNEARSELIGAIKRSIDAENTAVAIAHRNIKKDCEILLDPILDIDSNIRQFVENHEFFHLPSSEDYPVTRKHLAEGPEHQIKDEPTFLETDAANFENDGEPSWDSNDKPNEGSFSEDSENDSEVDGDTSGDDWKPDYISDSSMDDHAIPNQTPKPKAPGLECQTCGTSFKTKASLRTHMWRHQPQRRKELFVCKICGRGLSQSCHLRRHMATVHNPQRIQSKLKKASSSIKLKYKLQKSLPQFKCDHCPSSFKTPAHLRKHEILVHKTNFYQCSKCSWKSSSHFSSTLKYHMLRFHGTPEEIASLECSKCGKILSSKYALDSHQSSCNNPTRSKLVCEHCAKEFLHKENYLNHLGAAHGITDQLHFRCTFEGCGRAFSTKRFLSQHEVVHRPAQHECHICGTTFKTKEPLTRHLKVHESGGEKRYQCELCPARYARKDNLLAHMRRGVHKLSGAPDSVDGGEGRKGYKSKRQYKCSECELIFGWRSQLAGHLEKVHGGIGKVVTSKSTDEPRKKEGEPVKRKVRKRREPLKCPHCEKVQQTQKRLERHLRVCQDVKVPKVDGRYQCEHCSRSYNAKPNILRHLATVHGKKDLLRFVCSFESCGKSFPTKGTLEDHEDKHKEPSHKCEDCGLVFSQRSGLMTHRRRIHLRKEGTKKIKGASVTCEKCNLSIPSRKKLKKHLDLIHGVKPIEAPVSHLCPICKSTFSSKSAVQTHVEMVHERKMEACCDICGSVVGSHYLKKHKAAVHNIGAEEVFRFHCAVEQCTKRFSSQGELRRHIRLGHEKQRPFQCELCGKEVISKVNLRRHINAMHTNRESKPFKCEVCGKGFAIDQYLWLHMKTHQKKESGTENLLQL